MGRFIGLIGLVVISVASLSFLALGAHQGFGPATIGLFLLIIAILFAAALGWYRLSFHQDKVWFATGIIVITPPILFYSFILINNLGFVHETKSLRENIKLSNYSDEFIEWPGSAAKFGIRIRFEIEIPPNTGGQFYGPVVVKDQSSLNADSFFSDYAIESVGLHPIQDIQKSISNSRNVITYDLYPLQSGIRGLNLNKICHRTQDMTKELKNLKNLKVVYWIASGGGNIDISERMQELIHKESKLINSENIKLVYKSLSKPEMIKIGYEQCPSEIEYENRNDTMICYCKTQ